MIAFLDSGKKYGRLKAPAACVFPARKKFLERNGYRFPEIQCPEYEAWRKGLPVTHLSLIFATAYPNNPASMFGHTFLRLNGPGAGRDLLDYAVNFAATTGTSNGIEFALFGVFGGYEGHFSLAPYFIKVNEYNHGEARDLWEYPLELSDQSIDMLLAHLWEIEASSYFDYYFVDENCSWQILKLIEAAAPELDLTSDYASYVIPGDTVKTLSREGVLKDPVFRPSLRKIYTALESESEKKLLYYRLRERLGKNDQSDKKAYHKALTEKSKTPESIRPPEVPVSLNRPDLGHGVRRFGVTQGTGFRRLSFRIAQHDLLDRDVGHEPWSALDVLRIVPEERDRKLLLRELTIADVTSLHQWDGLDYEPSWYLQLGAGNPREFDCLNCFTATLRVGLGQTIKINEHIIAALFLGNRSYGASRSQKGIETGVAARSILGLSSENFKLLIDLERIWGIGEDRTYLADLSASYALGEQQALRLSSSFLFDGARESSVTVLFYY